MEDNTNYKKDWSDWVLETVFVLVFLMAFIVSAIAGGLWVGAIAYFGN